MGTMMPLFLIAMYERDGQPAEKILRNYIRTKFYWPWLRPYKTENLYEVLEQEGEDFAEFSENKTTTKTRTTPCFCQQKSVANINEKV